jgi:flagellar hook-associated protein 3 FlgL
MMRVTFNTMADSLATQMAGLTAQQATLQNQVASGLQFTQLSDNPSGMRTVLNLQTESSQNAQYLKNITALQQTATSSYGAMQQLQTLATRAAEITTLASDTAGPTQLNTYAAEVTQLIQQGVQLMNSQSGGEYLFGGTANTQPPYVATTDADGNVTAVTYQGNSSVSSAEIAPGHTVSAQVPGSNTTGSGAGGLITDSRSGADFFNHLIALQNDLQAGNTAAISATDAPALAKDEDNIVAQIGDNGAIQSQLSDASSMATTQSTSLTNMISQDADADLAQTMTKLTAAQNAYQAALESGASLLNQNQSLLYYLG